MRFTFTTPDRIIFGPGRAREVGELAKPFGTRALTIADRDRTRVASVLESLETAGIPSVPFEVTHEPTTSSSARGSNGRERRAATWSSASAAAA